MRKLGRKYTTRIKLLIALAILLASGLFLVILEKANVINLYNSSSDQTSVEEDDAQTTSTTETAQSDFNGGEFREPGNTLIDGEGSAIVTDNNGEIRAEIDKSNPIVSPTGEISVYSPRKDDKITNGFAFAGSSSLPKVSYRLIDSATGMIATGELTVVNGNFSGTITFSTGATQGRLDVFGTNENLTEFSNIEIPVRFQP